MIEPAAAAACFALLDDCTATEADPRSRLHEELVRTLSCTDADELPRLLEQMQQALAEGLHAVGLFSHELGVAMHGLPLPAIGQPLAQVLLFRHCRRMSSAQVEQWLAERGEGVAGVAGIAPGSDERAFEQAVARIHRYLEAGDTYQVNYTWRLRFDAYGDPAVLYRRLRQRQPVPYGALVLLPDGGAVLSLSPELFVRHVHGVLEAQPMKGTARASGDAQQDARRMEALAADPKNRAENLMIVDLLRNDLGRIAVPGSVQVPSLFDVRRHGAVLQMTSSVQARPAPDTTLAGVFDALYPCGSVTGAPKRRTMQIIDELEASPRGIYTGAIGWFEAPREEASPGDFCLSVPIRTLALQAPDGGLRRGEMGVGAGIVHDSTAADEYAECRLKANFLTGLRPEFELFETMHATREHGCRQLDAHLRRLAASAAYFGFPFDEAGIRRQLVDRVPVLPSNQPHRLRLALDADGTATLTSAPLQPLADTVRVLLSSEPTDARDLFLRHKTTLRERYDAGWRSAEAAGAFDMLFFNADGHLTEGGRSNVFVQLGGRWYTPPLAAGVLPGVMRAVLLADPAWSAVERALTREDLRRAERIVVCNALRGAVSAVLA